MLETPSQAHRIAPLDGLRGLAILLVMLHHSFHVPMLWMGVDLFFVLSGFLITSILAREKRKTFGEYLGHFYKRRAQRIWPSYLVTLLLCVACYGTFWLHFWYLYVLDMNLLKPLNLPSIQVLPLWSLAVEEQFYLIWPIAVFLLPRRRLIQICGLLIVGAPLLRYLYTPILQDSWAIYMQLPFRMDTLATGSLIALLWPAYRDRAAQSEEFRRKLMIVAVPLVALSVGVIGYFAHHGVTVYYATAWGEVFIFASTLLIATCIFVIALAGCINRLFTFKPLLWLGTLSYTIYLVHNIALDRLEEFATIRHTDLWISHLVIPVIAIVLTLLYAMASWRFMEQPILALGRSKPKSATL